MPHFGAGLRYVAARGGHVPDLRRGHNEDPVFCFKLVTSMTDTLFGKIIAGQIPCHKVYEDDRVLAFLDINPLTRGHTLVIPKEAAATLDKLSDDSAAALGRALPRICRAVMAATGVNEYNVLENNGPGAHQAVFHVHFHIIPKPNGDAGLGLRWPARGLDKAEAAEMVKLITQALQKTP